MKEHPRGPAAPALAARRVGHVYPDGRRALGGISFSVEAGESAGVIGPNGAGKTTLLLALGGLLVPTEGSIEVFGIRPDLRAGPEVRRRIGIVFQQTDDQLFSPTVFDDVAFGPLNFGFPRKEVRERVARALAAVGLEGFEGRSPHHLSQGEKRRAAIATVLSYEPDVLILDEPTSDLDPRGRRELVDLLAGMPQAKVIASHDLEFIARTCARTVVIAGGELRGDGPTGAVITDRTLLESNGLEVPLGLDGHDALSLGKLLGGSR